MKTLRALKITSILNGVFCLFCIASTVCFMINYHYALSVFHNIAYAFVYGWGLLYPIGLISLVASLIIFLIENRTPEAKQVIGKKYMWLYIWPIIRINFLLFAIIEFAWLVGGV